MCAITGIISSISTYNPLQLLLPMLAAMRHRGPDDSAQEIFNHYGCFGHNRLAILDLSERAKQPMWDAKHRYCLTFNGEIYNYRIIRQELQQLGHVFHTESDSEVLIEAWVEWHVASIQRFVGMFAFAIWDSQDQQLYMVRDRMGEKPLYYAPIGGHFNHGVVFASELKGLLQYPFIAKSLSMTALSHYLSFNYTATEDCIFEGIYKLPSASYFQYDLKTRQHTVNEYWSLAACFHNKLNISFFEAQEHLTELMAEAVSQQSVADVPLGAFLSGGIDSSTIVAEMCHNRPQQVRTYSIGFKEKTYSELALSEKTARWLGVQYQSKIVTPDIGQLLPKLAQVFDEPFADTSIIPTYLLCAFAGEQVTVSLSGDGGDELFGGYLTYQADRYYQAMQHVPLRLRKWLIQLSHYLPTSFAKVSLDYKIKQFLRGSLLNAQQAHVSWREIFTQAQKQHLFGSELNEQISKNTMERPLRWFGDVADCHYLDQAMYVDMKTWLVDDILVKVDRTAMANSLEVRAPFLDHRFVEFAARLPIEYKIQGSNGKRILKASQQKKLPPHVLRQPKRGFNSPISHWLSNALYPMAYEITTDSALIQWFDKDIIEKMWFEHRNKRCDNSHRLFNLLCLGLWCQCYLK